MRTKKVKSEKKARVIIAETKVQGILASTARVLSRLVAGLATYSKEELTLKKTIENAKAALETRIESLKADWKAIKAEHKDPKERKALEQSIYDALQVAPFGLAKQRATEVCRKIGIVLRPKGETVRTAVAKENIEKLFLLADKLEEGDGRRVCALLSRAYGKGRDVYRDENKKAKEEAEAAKA